MSDENIVNFLVRALETQPEYLSNIHQQGYDAAQRGLHPADCPFDEGTESADKWREGWSRGILEAA